jgi:general secretion pathway protein A
MGMSSGLTIYNAHFGLSERPFTLLPDPDFLYWSDNHARAYAMLEYGMLTHAPITVITGEIGAGKTTLLRQMLRSLPSDVSVGLVSNAQGDRGELLHWVLMALDVPTEAGAGYVQLFARFQDHLIGQYAAGRRTMLIFDEAQNLSVEALEELRMFSNINADKDELLQLVLVGQPELRDLIASPRLVQFAQRVAADYHLPAMSPLAVGDYVRHRLRVAGATREIFTPAACEVVHAAARGVPRLVNQLCDYALVYAFTDGHDRIDAGVIEQVARDRRMHDNLTMTV